MICKDIDTWFTCGEKIRTSIKNSYDWSEAIVIAKEWDSIYGKLYEQNQQTGWSISDEQRIEDVMSTYWDEYVGKYLKPDQIALSLALAAHFPKLAKIVFWLSPSQEFVLFYNLIAPSPIANDFTDASILNKGIQEELRKKLPPIPVQTIQERFQELFKKSYEITKGAPLG